MLRLTDLREILRYVPRFREKIFVIAMDGAVVADDNFGNILLDLAVRVRPRRVVAVRVPRERPERDAGVENVHPAAGLEGEQARQGHAGGDQHGL